MDCYIPETRITKVSMSGSGGGGIAMRAHDQHWGAATPGAHAYVTMATIVAPSPRSCDNSVRGLNLRPPLFLYKPLRMCTLSTYKHNTSQ